MKIISWLMMNLLSYDDESPREEEGEVLDEGIFMNEDQPFDMTRIQLKMVSDYIIVKVRIYGLGLAIRISEGMIL
jgi:hypothetical protein